MNCQVSLNYDQLQENNQAVELNLKIGVHMTKGIVRGIISNLVIVEVDGPVSQNEICYIILGDTRLMAEVIKIIAGNAYVQVFESTRNLRSGDTVEFQGHMLEVSLGPGI